MQSDTAKFSGEIARAYDAWWRGLTRKGDPMQRPNLIREAFEAGYRVAVALHSREQ